MPNFQKLCRICMSVNIKMFTLINTNMEILYNILTQVHVDAGDGKPTTVCFLCYAKLRQCVRLQQRAIKSNELLEQLLKGGLMQAKTNTILNGQYSSQDLQVSSTYHLDLEPANCADVLLDPKVEANDLISVKEEVEAIDEGCNVTANAILSDQYSSQDLQVSSTYYLELEPTNCEGDLLDPKVEVDMLSVNDDEAKDEDCNDTENLCIIQHEKRVTNYLNPSYSDQVLKKDKKSYSSKEVQEINMKSETNVEEKNRILITNKRHFSKAINNDEDLGADKKSEKRSEKTTRNAVQFKQKVQKSIHSIDTQQQNIKSPINTFTDEYKCDECGNQFPTKDILTDHILKCMKTTKTSLSDSQLTKADTLKSLLLSMYKCNICPFKTYNKRSIENHLKMHNVSKVFSCTICEYRCTLKIDLIRHVRKHTGEKPFSCNICEYRCAQKSNLVTHIKTHTDEKPLCCNICEYRCARERLLKDHMRRHTGEKPLSCNICEYRCSQKGDLIKHIRKHTGEKPFACNICEYRSSQKGDLMKHTRKHTGEKPFSCNICEFKCARKHYLKDHMRTHTGEKPFFCNICDFRFVQKGNLMRHIKTHTGE